MRGALLVISVCALLFLGLASASPNAVIVGKVGNVIGSANYKAFGVVALFYPFFLIYPVIRGFQNIKKLNLHFYSRAIGVFLLVLAILLSVSMFKQELGGAFGNWSIESLKSFFGNIGTIVFVIMIYMISFGLVFDDRIDVVIKKAFVEKSPYNQIYDRQKVKKSLNLAKQTNLNEPKQTNLNKKSDETPNLNQNSDQSVEFDLKIEDEPKITATGVEILSEVAENKELLNQIEKGKFEKPKDFMLPPIDFLKRPPRRQKNINEVEIDQKIADLLEKLRKFKIDGDVTRTYSGPVVTTFEFKPAPSVKVSKILNLQDDLAMALKAQTIRIQAPIPGKDVVGIEIPNKSIETIYLREILESDIYKNSKSELTIALGKDIVGDAFITDLKKLPHLLIAGTTGSGKSVGINAMVLSLLYRNSPQTLRLIMIDPKMLEFSVYNDIPHLLTPVITQPKQAIGVLDNLVAEMERRYKLMSQTKTKNIESYNEKMRALGEEILPFIVVIIDELADLMMTSGKDVEFSIGRLAQMARASGIHLIVATQRPSVDVVTGLIKANLPSRISFRVGQKIDSKVILDQMGAESLLGRGDMLFTPPGNPGLVRLHAPFASEEEIENIVEFLKNEQSVSYDESFLNTKSEAGMESGGIASSELDELYDQAYEIIHSEGKTSISYIQRRLNIGYNRAANIIEQLEANGVLGEANAKGQREILR